MSSFVSPHAFNCLLTLTRHLPSSLSLSEFPLKAFLICFISYILFKYRNTALGISPRPDPPPSWSPRPTIFGEHDLHAVQTA